MKRRPSRLGPWLAVSSAALVLLTILLFVLLHKPPLEQQAVQQAPRPRSAEPQHRSVLRRAPPPPPASAARPAAATSAPAPKSEPGTGGYVDPLGVHVAPPALPPEIQQERDPARRAQLLREHAAFVARVRASRLRRHVALLSTTLARARAEKNWTPAQVERAERSLAKLKAAVPAAEAEVKRAEQAAGQR